MCAGRSQQETPRPVRPGFDRQKCRHAVHAVLWPQPLQDLYGVIRRRRPQHPSQDGRDAQDMERPGSGFHGHPPCLFSRAGAPHRECSDEGESSEHASTGTHPRETTIRTAPESKHTDTASHAWTGTTATSTIPSSPSPTAGQRRTPRRDRAGCLWFPRAATAAAAAATAPTTATATTSTTVTATSIPIIYSTKFKHDGSFRPNCKSNLSFTPSFFIHVEC